MSKRQHQKLDAIARFLPDGEHKFLRRLVDYANDDGAGAFPRRKTLVTETGKSRRWLQLLEQRLVERGWLRVRIVGAGCARRTFYRLTLPTAAMLEAIRWRQGARLRGQLELPLLWPVEKSAENLLTNVDADLIQSDPGILFAAEIRFLSDCGRKGLASPADSDPKNLDPKNVQKKERPTLARRHSSFSYARNPERLRFAERQLKASLDAERERRRLARGNRRGR